MIVNIPMLRLLSDGDDVVLKSEWVRWYSTWSVLKYCDLSTVSHYGSCEGEADGDTMSG